jgi:hypothetical protein
MENRGRLHVSKPGIVSVPKQIAAATGIAQDNVIFAMILFAFIVWITTKGELQTYIAFFKPGAATGPATDPVTASSTTGGATGSTSTAPFTPAPAAGGTTKTVIGSPASALPTWLQPYVPSWLNTPGLTVTTGAQPSVQLGPTNYAPSFGSGFNGNTPAVVPGQANPIPGFSAIGTWLKSVTGIGQ